MRSNTARCAVGTQEWRDKTAEALGVLEWTDDPFDEALPRSEAAGVFVNGGDPKGARGQGPAGLEAPERLGDLQLFSTAYWRKQWLAQVGGD